MNNENFQNDKNNNPPIKKFFDNRLFSLRHVYPENTLWIDHPSENKNWAHCHNFLELGRLVKGYGSFYVDGQFVPVSAPCYTILFPGQFHSAHSSDKNCEWNYLYIDLDFFIEFLPEAVKTKILSNKEYSFPNILDKNEYFMVSEICDIIFKENTEKNYSLEFIKGLIIALLCKFTEYFIGRDSKNEQIDSNSIREALDYVNNFYYKEIKIEELADLSHMSLSTLRRNFNKITKMSPLEYIHRVRLNNAITLLINTEKSILDISLEIGYTTLSSFNRHFLNMYKTSPLKYRHQYSKLKNA